MPCECGAGAAAPGDARGRAPLYAASTAPSRRADPFFWTPGGASGTRPAPRNECRPNTPSGGRISAAGPARRSARSTRLVGHQVDGRLLAAHRVDARQRHAPRPYFLRQRRGGRVERLASSWYGVAGRFWDRKAAARLQHRSSTVQQLRTLSLSITLWSTARQGRGAHGGSASDGTAAQAGGRASRRPHKSERREPHQKASTPGTLPQPGRLIQQIPALAPATHSHTASTSSVAYAGLMLTNCGRRGEGVDARASRGPACPSEPGKDCLPCSGVSSHTSRS